MNPTSAGVHASAVLHTGVGFGYKDTKIHQAITILRKNLHHAVATAALIWMVNLANRKSDF